MNLTRHLCLSLLLLCFFNSSAIAQKPYADPIAARKYFICNRLNDICEKGEKKDREKLELAKEYLRYCDLKKERTYCLSEVLDILARDAFKRNQLDSAIILEKEVVEIRKYVVANDVKDRFENSTSHTANALATLATFYHEKAEYEAAISAGQEALDTFEESDEKNSTDHAKAMFSMANLLLIQDKQEDIEKAIKLNEKAIEIFNPNTNEYFESLLSLLTAYSKKGEEDKARKVEENIDKYGKRAMKKNPGLHARKLAEYMVRAYKNKSYDASFKDAEKAEKAFERSQKSNSQEYVKFLNNYAKICIDRKKYDVAKRLLEKAEKAIDSLDLKDQNLKYECYILSRDLNLNIQDYGNADKYQAIVEEMQSDYDNIDVATCKKHEDRAEMLMKRGEYAKGIKTEKDAIKSYRRLNEHRHTADALKTLANYYLKTDSFQQAVDSAKLAMQIAKHEMDSVSKEARRMKRLRRDVKKDNDDERYIFCMAQSILSQAYYKMKNIDSAWYYAKNAVDVFRQNDDTLTMYYVNALSNMGLYSYYRGDTIQGMELTRKACLLQDSLQGKEHPDNITALYNLAIIASGKNDSLSLVSYDRAIRMQMEALRSEFSFLPTIERENRWNERHNQFQTCFPLLYKNQNNNDSIVALAYDMQMFTKGLLLNSEINFVQLLQNDKNLRGNYNELQLLQEQIKKYRGDTLLIKKEEARKLERKLIRGSKQYGDFMEAMNTSWQKLKNNLRKGDMAIEMINGSISGRGQTYIALCLKPEWNSPKMRVLFSEYDLDNLGWKRDRLNKVGQDHKEIDSLYNDERIGHLVWGALSKDLQGVSNLYFSPSGILQQIAIEYLNTGNGKCIADRYSTHRLSSTRLLTKKAETPMYQEAVVFGGLKYGTVKQDSIEEHDDNEWEMFMENKSRAASLIRSTVGDLSGAKQEATKIAELLESNKITCERYMDEKGTEEDFKDLNEKKKNIIHIATHGFAITAEEAMLAAKEDSRYNTLLSNPLSRTGLLLTGANHTIEKNLINEENQNDGILTAQEISVLNLSGAHLVVLSACKTAQGEIREDGVFGLQRGFKKAGAETLMMSLWNANDWATLRLMEKFYQAFTQEGKAPHEALQQARQYLRNIPQYNRPCMWAPFILMDAM